ncbi:hypothetical protein [Novosphingobium sp. YAF33]|uniref:hypothetical protein n=1 Tax=Novosphingobium sp. YAF33 TaxID=3233082 RepID=UPI003F97A82F
MPAGKRGLTLLGLLAAPALATTGGAATGGAATGVAAQWQRLFVPSVENTLGRSVYVDKASVKAGMIGRQFRQMQVLLRANAGYPQGTVLYTERAVDCTGSRALSYHWRIVRSNGTVLRDWSDASPSISGVQWAGEDGLVLKYVCTGVLPR